MPTPRLRSGQVAKSAIIKVLGNIEPVDLGGLILICKFVWLLYYWVAMRKMTAEEIKLYRKMSVQEKIAILDDMWKFACLGRDAHVKRAKRANKKRL